MSEDIAPDKLAVIQELFKRRHELPEDKRAIVTELASRAAMPQPLQVHPPEELKNNQSFSSRLRQGFSNIPYGIANNAINLAKGPQMGGGIQRDSSGKMDINADIRPLINMVNHPVESLTTNPIETTQAAVMAGKGLKETITNPVVQGAAKGAYSEATDMVPFNRYGHHMSIPKPLLGAAAGETAGYMAHALHPNLPIAGAAIGAAFPIIRGAYRGGKAALEEGRIRNFASSGGNEPLPPVTYSEPTPERASNLPVDYSKSPELPDWMKEEVTPVPETIESVKAKKVSDPRVTKAKKNYENTKTPVTSPYENTKFEPESIIGKRPASSPAYPDFEATGEATEQPAASAQTLPVQPLAPATGVTAGNVPEALQPAVQKPVMPNMPSNDPNVIYDFENQPVVKKGTEVPNSEVSDPLESYKAQEQINSEIRARNALNKDQDLVRHLKDQGITKEQFQAMTPENRSALAKDIKHEETTYYPPEHPTKSGRIMNLKGRSKYTGFNEGRINQFLDLWKD